MLAGEQHQWADLTGEARRVIAEMRDLAQDCQAVRLALRQTISQNRRLRAELRAELAGRRPLAAH